MSYVKKVIGNGALKQTVWVDEVTGEQVVQPKAIARNSVAELGIDPLDMIADAAKMNSLILSMLSRIYASLTEEQKTTFTPEEKALTEFTLVKFSETDTWADIQLKEEGSMMIERLLDRQAEIAIVVAAAKGITA